MKPRLPDAPSGSGYIDRISSNWFRDLLRCVDWAMNNPRGDGATILNKGDGIMTAVQSKKTATVSAGVVMLVITTRPPGGYGQGYGKLVTLDASGIWIPNGDEFEIIIPKQV